MGRLWKTLLCLNQRRERELGVFEEEEEEQGFYIV